MLAYLKLVANIKDDEAFKRIINFPARGIGDTSLGRLKEAATRALLDAAIARAEEVVANRSEVLTAEEYWPVATYGELLFKV